MQQLPAIEDAISAVDFTAFTIENQLKELESTPGVKTVIEAAKWIQSQFSERLTLERAESIVNRFTEMEALLFEVECADHFDDESDEGVCIFVVRGQAVLAAAAMDSIARNIEEGDSIISQIEDSLNDDEDGATDAEIFSLGFAGVDSGLLMVVDPGYVLSDEDYQTKVLDRMYPKGAEPLDYLECKGGVVFSTAFGDGAYDVLGRRNTDGLLTDVFVDLDPMGIAEALEQDSLQDGNDAA